MSGSVKISGFRELERDLLRLGEKDARRIGRRAVRRAAKPVYDAARANVPVREGRLRKSIKLRVDFLRGSTALGRVASALVYVEGKLGYRPRKSDRQSTVKGKLGPARYSYQIGTRPDVYGRFIEFGIPGHAPQPFLRPAFDSHANRAVDIMGKDLGDGIEAALRA